MMRAVRHLLSQASLVTALLLASCTTPPPPPPPTPPPPVIPTIMPLPPLSSAEGMDLPPVDLQGRYITPNRGMTGQQALWHVRMALNVAALGCRDAGDMMGVEYNRMLRIHAVPLAQANTAADAIYTLKHGADAIATRDRVYTVVYNFFALPPAQKAFCPAARSVVTTINAMPPDALIAYAPQALEILEKPFQDFWEAYADYLRRLEEWRRRFARASVTVLPCPDTDPACGGSAVPSPPPSAPFTTAPPPVVPTGVVTTPVQPPATTPPPKIIAPPPR